MTTIEQQSIPQSPEVRYDYSPYESKDVFGRAMTQIEGSIDTAATNVLVVSSDTELANYVRTIEAQSLPTIPQLMTDYEDGSRFVLVLQDYDQEVVHTEPAHTFRIHDTKRRGVGNESLPVGLLTFDDSIKQGLVTEEQLLAFYEVKSLRELGREYVNVETNIANREVPFTIRRPYSALGYRAIFEIINSENYRGVVAYQNPEAIKSLGHLGLISVPLVGNTEISVEDEDKLLDSNGEACRYYPLTVESVPWSHRSDGSPEHNHKIFTDTEYAKEHSRIAALVAAKPLNVINIK